MPALMIALPIARQTDLGPAVARPSAHPDGIGDCKTQRIRGSVKNSETFVRRIRPTLDLVLLPDLTPELGWTLKIVSSGGSDGETYGDHIYPVSPPYRFFNPRYIGAIYGFSATQALEMRERSFNFVMQKDLSAAQEAIGQEAIRGVLWPKGADEGSGP